LCDRVSWLRPIEWPYKQLGKKTFTNYLPKDSKVPKTAEHRDKKKHKGNNKASKASIQLPPVEGNHSQVDVTANLTIDGSGNYNADSDNAHDIEDLLMIPSN
jgi:septin family protein